MILPKSIGKNTFVYQIVFKHPFDDIPILISFPDESIQATDSLLNTTVRYSRINNSNIEYEPINFHNYSIRVKAVIDIDIVDTYFFGSNHYVGSWIWAVVGTSFMLTSACFHNFETTSGKLSSFTFFLYFYIVYRLIDTFYSIFYNPNIWISTTSVILFPGVAAYIMTYLEN